MKKLLAMVLVLVMVLSLGACGGGNGSSVKATIIDNDGATVSLSSKEILEIYNGNEAKFDKSYEGAQVTIAGTIESIEAGRNSSLGQSVYGITLEEGWWIMVLKNSHDEVVDLVPGDKVTITSTLQGCSVDKVELFSISSSGKVFKDKSTITIQ